MGTITISVVGDRRYEANETFSVVLSAPTNAALGDDTGTGTITDNDPAPVISVTDATVTELTPMGQNRVAKGLIPAELATHGMEMYGTMAVYLRLKGIVPPTTERQYQQMKKSQ